MLRTYEINEPKWIIQIVILMITFFQRSMTNTAPEFNDLTVF